MATPATNFLTRFDNDSDNRAAEIKITPGRGTPGLEEGRERLMTLRDRDCADRELEEAPSASAIETV